MVLAAIQRINDLTAWSSIIQSTRMDNKTELIIANTFNDLGPLEKHSSWSLNREPLRFEF